MRKVTVIGIGAGDPRHMTIQAIEALNAVDAVFLLDKGEEKADLVHVREAICARFLDESRLPHGHGREPAARRRGRLPRRRRRLARREGAGLRRR